MENKLKIPACLVGKYDATYNQLNAALNKEHVLLLEALELSRKFEKLKKRNYQIHFMSDEARRYDRITCKLAERVYRRDRAVINSVEWKAFENVSKHFLELYRQQFTIRHWKNAPKWNTQEIIRKGRKEFFI